MSSYSALLKQDGKLLLPICLGHFLSHFYLFCLGPLVTVIHFELDISYTSLGSIITIFALASGALQTPVGFLVDRLGAGIVLVTGLFLMAGAVALMGFAPNYYSLVVLAVVAGIGHSVFHPANYALLSRHVDSSRLGKAFSLHTFAAQLGNASVPIVMAGLLAYFDWRLALILVGTSGLMTMIWFIAVSRSLPNSNAKTESKGTESKENVDAMGWRLLLSPPMIFMFYFFFIVAFVSTGVLTFSAAAFVILHDLTILQAGTVLTGFMLAGAIGVLAGGILADKMNKHDLIAVITFAVTAAVMAVLGAMVLPFMLILVLFVFVGFFHGLLRPARDMMIQSVTPGNDVGKVFGFVSSGISLGSGVAPILFGWLIDQGKPEWIFFTISILLIVGIISVFSTQKHFANSNDS